MADRVVIALFRHGITEENKRRAYLGWNDSPLAAEAKESVVHEEYDAYFSSDLGRCIAMAKQLFPDKTPILLQELREMNFGEWQGRTYEQLQDNRLYQQWLSNPYHSSPPKGESFQQFADRIEAGWKKIVEFLLNNRIHSCAVMTHGGVIKYLLAHYAPQQQEFWNWKTPHDVAFKFIFSKQALRRGERCTLLQEVPLTVKGHG